MAARGVRLPGGEFRALWTAEALSVLGDQLAKVALGVIVYQRTGSAAWSGLAYALTLVPPVVTARLLAPLADRYPRREVMVICCLVQAVLVAVMAVPQVPLPLLAVAVAAVAATSTPFRAAQGALVLDVLGAELNKAGGTRLMMIREGGQLVGLAGAAAVVGFVGTTVALVLDVVSFLGAAALLRAGLRGRAAVRAGAAADARRPSPWRVLYDDRTVRLLVVLILATGLTMVPDAVVMPLVDQSDAPVWAVGLLLASDCLGLLLGGWWVERQTPNRQRALIGPLAVLNMVPLTLFVVDPGVVLTGVLLVLSGVGAAYLPLAAGEFKELVPRTVTGTSIGLLNAALRASQGVAVVAGGVLAQHLRSAAAAVAVAGTLGVVVVGFSLVLWHRGLRTRPVSAL
ncbi:hypothetical protein SUDANB95_08012 (plasmid) [Actinosynnema sp. ALI-1.44]